MVRVRTTAFGCLKAERALKRSAEKLNVWKRLWSIALCLCAAACVLCVSAAAADDSSIPMPNWSESLRRTINYGTSVMYISGSFSDFLSGEIIHYI